MLLRGKGAFLRRKGGPREADRKGRQRPRRGFGELVGADGYGHCLPATERQIGPHCSDIACGPKGVRFGHPCLASSFCSATFDLDLIKGVTRVTTIMAYAKFSPLRLAGALAALVVLGETMRLAVHKDVFPVATANDFHFYWEALQRFLTDPKTLYLPALDCDLRGFLYPPPAIAMFLPFAGLSQVTALVLFRIIGVLGMVASVWVLARIFEGRGIALRPWDRASLLIVALALGPHYTNMLYGQVNTFLLLDCLAFRLLLDRRRPMIAGAVVAAGAWFKVYPLLCLVFVLLWERRAHDTRRLLIGFGATAALVPVICCPFVPFDLYRVYATDVFPVLGSRTFQNILNQSLLAASTRTGAPMGNFIDWELCPFSVVPATWARVLNGAVALGSVVGLGLWARHGDAARRLASYFCLLATIPIVSTLGWAYVYVLAVPALLLALRCAPKSAAAYLLLLGASVSYLVPATHALRPLLRLPEILRQVVYDRYLLTTFMVCGLLVFTGWVALPKEESSPGRL